MNVWRDCSTQIRPNRADQGLAALGKWSRKYCRAPRLQTPGNPGAAGDFITQLGQGHVNK